ncbi:MAG: short-chain [Geobacteraceae bacterium]|nr:MAG: short-chain [Geobacteraceae bacterium]
MKLKGKVALVTGAGRGLGRASAIAMAHEGADLVIVSRTPAELEETARVIMDGGGTVVILEADVGRSAEVRQMVDTAVETFGSIDILMNNAAIIGPLKHLYEVEEGEWDRAFAINLKAAFLLSKEVIPHMIRQGSGKIINVTTGMGEIVMPPFGTYSVTKAGLIHLTRIMAEELKVYNIRVNGLDPAVMDTGMQEEIRGFGPAVLGEEVFERFLAMKERGELLSPDRVARLAVFLATTDRVTGENGTENHYRKFGYTGG